VTQKAVKVIRKERKVYQKYKDATHPAYRQAQKKAKVQLKKAKKEFEKKLAKISRRTENLSLRMHEPRGRPKSKTNH